MSSRQVDYCATSDEGDPIPTYLTKNVEVASFDRPPNKLFVEYMLSVIIRT